MTEPVRRQVNRLWPKLGDKHVVIEEIPGPRGIIDLLVAEFDRGAMARRVRRSVGPILRAEQVQILWALRDHKPHRVSTIAKLGGWSPSVIASTLPTLASTRLITVSNGQVEATGRWEPVGRRLLAIELKRSAWRRALRQATYFTYAADRAIVALDWRSAGAVEDRVAEFVKRKVGLALVSSSGELRVVHRPPRNHPIGWLRALLAECAWARSG
jgi:hypothetical protein